MFHIHVNIYIYIYVCVCVYIHIYNNHTNNNKSTQSSPSSTCGVRLRPHSGPAPEVCFRWHLRLAEWLGQRVSSLTLRDARSSSFRWSCTSTCPQNQRAHFLLLPRKCYKRLKLSCDSRSGWLPSRHSKGLKEKQHHRLRSGYWPHGRSDHWQAQDTTSDLKTTVCLQSLAWTVGVWSLGQMKPFKPRLKMKYCTNYAGRRLVQGNDCTNWRSLSFLVAAAPAYSEAYSRFTDLRGQRTWLEQLPPIPPLNCLVSCALKTKPWQCKRSLIRGHQSQANFPPDTAEGWSRAWGSRSCPAQTSRANQVAALQQQGIALVLNLQQALVQLGQAVLDDGVPPWVSPAAWKAFDTSVRPPCPRPS